MVNIVGVRFKKAGKIYYFDPLDMELALDDAVIVETARGVELGVVSMAMKAIGDDEVVAPLKPVLRKATDEDVDRHLKNIAREKEAISICKEKIAAHGLDMKLVDVEFTFDMNKVIFYFTADGRVDFRDLVKDLASVFRTRIELRQIGVRDEAKMKSGIGPCGRTLCCASFLSDFTSVSIKMAKEQNLSLNPTKISGICGRLMCCLKYEQETYEDIRKRLPRYGSIVNTPLGRGEVIMNNTIKEQVKVRIFGDGEDVIEYFPISECEMIKGSYEDNSGRKDQNQNGEGDQGHTARPPREKRKSDGGQSKSQEGESAGNGPLTRPSRDQEKIKSAGRDQRRPRDHEPRRKRDGDRRKSQDAELADAGDTTASTAAPGTAQAPQQHETSSSPKEPSNAPQQGPTAPDAHGAIIE